MSAHTHTVYAVLAAGFVTYLATANVGMVDDKGTPGAPADSVWQSYAGGREVRHCFVLKDKTSVCADADMGDGISWGESVIFVDPVNLGHFIEVLQVAGDGEVRTLSAAGAIDASGDNQMRIGPGQGVWAVVAGSETVMHCQIEQAKPRCRALPEEGGLFGAATPPTILGVFPSSTENVLWLARTSEVFRCTATSTRPQPECVAARMQ